MPNKYIPCENLEGEIWKSIPKLIGRYEVSNLGRIKSLRWRGKSPRAYGFTWKYKEAI